MWLKTTRITLLVALLVAVAILAYLAGHPRLYAGHIGRLLTRHVLENAGWTFQCRDLGGNPLGHMRFYDVTMTHDSQGGDFAYITCDSLEVQYEVGGMFRRNFHLALVAIYGPEMTLRRASQPAQITRSAPTTSLTPPGLRVDLAEFYLENGAATIQPADGGVADRLERVQIIASARARGGAFDFELQDLSGRWPTRGVERLRFRGTGNYHEGKLEVEDATAVLDSTQAELDLSLDFSEDDAWSGELRGSATGFELASLLALFGKEIELDLRADGEVEMTLGQDRFTLEGKGTGSLDGHPFDAERVVMGRDGQRIYFERMEGEYLGAVGTATGDFDLDSKRLELDCVAEQIDLSQPWVEDSEWPASQLSGEVSLSLEALEEPRFSLSARDVQGTIFGTSVDSVAIRLLASESTGVELTRLDGRILDSTAHLSGTIDAQERCDLLVRLQTEDAAAVLQQLGFEGSALGVSAAGTIRGPLDDPSLTASVFAKRVSYGQYRGYDCDSQVEVKSLRSARTVAGTGVLGALLLNETALGSVEAEFRRFGDRVEIDRLFFAHGDTTLQTAFALEQHDDRNDLHFRELVFGLADHSWTLDKPSTVRVAARRWSADGIGFSSESGVLQLRGELDLDGAIEVDLSVKRGDLAFLSWAGLLPTEMTGEVSASIELRGRTSSPTLDARLDVREATVLGERYRSAQLHLHSDGPQFEVQPLRVLTDHGRLSVSGRADLSSAGWLVSAFENPHELRELFSSAELDLTVRADSVEIEEWVPNAEGVGFVHASLELTGSAELPELRGDVDLIGFQREAVVLPAARATVVSDGSSVRLVDGYLLMPEPWLSFEARLPLELRLTRVPRLLPEQNLRVAVFTQGPTDLAPLSTCIPAILEAKGSMELNYQAVGSWEEAELRGALNAKAESLRFVDLVEPFREVELRGGFSKNRFEIERAFAREGEKGRIEAKGGVEFAGLVPDDFDLRADVHRFLLLSVPELRAIVSSTRPLRLRLVRPLPGEPRVPKLEGAVLIDRAIYIGEFQAAPGVGGPSVLAPTAAPPWMADLQIQLRDQVRISNSIAELRLSGDMDFVRDLSGLRLRGVAEISQGSVTIAQLLDFDITEGRLDFSRGTGLEPAVELTAETEVPVYHTAGAGRDLELVTVRVTGTFSEPELSFSSVTGYDEKTIINLLAGIPVDSGAEEARIQEMALRMAGNQIGRELADAIRGIDTVQVETGDPTEEGGSRTQIGVGKYLDLADKPLYVRYSQGLSISERDIYMEYQLRRRFLLTFEMQRRLEQAVPETSVSADLKFRVEY